MPHALQCGSSGAVPPARRVAAAAVGRAGPERILPLGAAAGGGTRPQCTARRTDSISLTSPTGRPRPAGPAPPPPAPGAGRRYTRLGTAARRHSACWEAPWRGTRPGTGNGTGTALPRPGTADGTGIGSANAITGPAGTGTGARLCAGGISAGIASMALGTALPWDRGQRWHGLHRAGTALLGPRPEPAHLPQAVLGAAQGLAASPPRAWRCPALPVESAPAVLACSFLPRSSGARDNEGLLHYTALQASPQSSQDTTLAPGPAPPALAWTLHR